MSNKTTPIITIDDVRRQIKYWMETDCLNFHPDTPMKDYVSAENGLPVFSYDEAEINEGLLDACQDVCDENGMDIYAISLEIFWEVYPGLSKSL